MALKTSWPKRNGPRKKIQRNRVQVDVPDGCYGVVEAARLLSMPRTTLMWQIATGRIPTERHMVEVQVIPGEVVQNLLDDQERERDAS